MMKKHLYTQFLLAVILALLLIGCANTQEQTSQAVDTPPASQGTTTPDTTGVVPL